MNTFWRYAKEMLVDRWLLIAALSLSVLASAGLGAGLAGVAPILETMLPRTEGGVVVSPQTLRERAVQFNEEAQSWAVGVQIPQGVVDALPTDPFKGVLYIMIALGVLTVIASAATFGHQYLALTAVYRASQRIRDRAFGYICLAAYLICLIF